MLARLRITMLLPFKARVPVELAPVVTDASEPAVAFNAAVLLMMTLPEFRVRWLKVLLPLKVKFPAPPIISPEVAAEESIFPPIRKSPAPAKVLLPAVVISKLIVCRFALLFVIVCPATNDQISPVPPRTNAPASAANVMFMKPVAELLFVLFRFPLPEKVRFPFAPVGAALPVQFAAVPQKASVSPSQTND